MTVNWSNVVGWVGGGGGIVALIGAFLGVGSAHERFKQMEEEMDRMRVELDGVHQLKTDLAVVNQKVTSIDKKVDEIAGQVGSLVDHMLSERRTSIVPRRPSAL